MQFVWELLICPKQLVSVICLIIRFAAEFAANYSVRFIVSAPTLIGILLILFVSLLVVECYCYIS